MFFKKQEKIDITKLNIPKHIAVIMDGNGRWAKKRGLPRKVGHGAGAEIVKTIARYCSDIGVRYFTVYAFSTENWKRPNDEVAQIMILLYQYLENSLKEFLEKDVKVRIIGNISELSLELQQKISETEELTKNNKTLTVNIAINYGGRAEIVRAAKLAATAVKNGEIEPSDITEEYLNSLMFTNGQPDPELIIRPSGEFRISNFLLWQCAYSEFCFQDVLWPDFKSQDIDRAILEFNKRDRRFGGIN